VVEHLLVRTGRQWLGVGLLLRLAGKFATAWSGCGVDAPSLADAVTRASCYDRLRIRNLSRLGIGRERVGGACDGERARYGVAVPGAPPIRSWSSSQLKKRSARRPRALGSQCRSAPSSAVNRTRVFGPGSKS
jgi:hypothetical protein